MDRRKTIKKFQELAHEFRRAADSGDLDEMDEILAQRRRLLDRLAEDPTPSTLAPSERDELLREILTIDREAEAILVRSREEIGEELAALESGRRGLRGYAATTRASKWIDERG